MLSINFIGQCKSSNYRSKKRCLLKSEMGSFADFMQAGDPCFLRKGKRVCHYYKFKLCDIALKVFPISYHEKIVSLIFEVVLCE